MGGRGLRAFLLAVVLVLGMLSMVLPAGAQQLQAELAGTENRITVARKRYIDSINAYNVLVREFPVNLTAKVLGYAPKPQFSVENEAAISKPPTVDFGGGQSAPAAQPAPAAQ